MADKLTQLVDVITPEIYNKYIEQYSPEVSAFIRSGIAVANPDVSKNITDGGTRIHMPFWNDLSGDDEVLDDGDKALSTDKITAGVQMSTVMYRGRAWKVNELASVISGDDPLGSLMSKLAEYWVRREQDVLLSVLKGLFAKTGVLEKTHLLDISTNVGTDAKISGASILDTKQLLGDRAERVSGLAMHSAVYTELQKQQLIEFIPESINGSAQMIPTYLGYRILAVDDKIPVEKVGEDNVYTTYLFGTGSIGRNTGTPSKLTMFEMDREALKGNDVVITRRAFVMHPYGISYLGTEQTDITPSNAELANPKNYKKVYEDKNIALLALRHKI